MSLHAEAGRSDNGGLMRVGLRACRKLRLAAWSAVLALVLQSWLPVHLAQDIAHAIEDRLAGDEWTLDGRPAGDVASAEDEGHAHPDGGHSHPAHRDCALFLAAPGASAFVLPALLEFAHPDIATSAVPIAFAEVVRPRACPASYASRAPPKIA